MSETPSAGMVSADSGGFTVSTNTDTVESLKTNLASDKPEKNADEPDLAQAASALGRKGGAASAAKRSSEAPPLSPAEDEAAAASPEPEKLGKPRDDPRARMLEATREAAELKRTLAAKEAELAEARKARTEQPDLSRQLPDPEAKPVKDDYDNYEDFAEDLADWKANQVVRQFMERQAEEAAQKANQQSFYSRINSAASNYHSKITEAWPTKEAFLAEVDPVLVEWEPSFSLPPGVRPGPENAIADEIVAMDDPVPVMKYLSQHPDTLKRIAALTTPRAIAREMAKIEDRVAGDREEPVKEAETSKALPPVRIVKGSAHSVSDDPNEMNFDDYVRSENAKDRQRRAGRH